MKLCMYVGYHDANNVKFWLSPSDPIKFRKKRFKKRLRCFTGTVHHRRNAATGFADVATRPRACCWSMEDRRWPYQQSPIVLLRKKRYYKGVPCGCVKLSTDNNQVMMIPSRAVSPYAIC